VAQLIDTSVFIALERQQLDLDVLVRVFPDEPIALAAITTSELLAGVYYADSSERRQRREAFVERILNTLPVIPFDLSVARTYARLLVDLRKSGQTVGAHDLQIASTALALGLEVATYDVRDFGRVPGLPVRRIDSLY
jgi:tRNA(fMet)-specific endonuclease VapC